MVLKQVFLSKFEANQSRGLWVMIGHTNKQTAITTLYILIQSTLYRNTV